jgi:uncharacterized protein (DUF302 family)
MEKHTSHVTPDFTTGSAFIKGESTLAVVSIGTFDELAGKLERAIDGIGLEIVHVHEMDALLRERGVGVDFRCRVYEVWNATLASKLIGFDADVGHVLPCRITLHDQGGVTTVVAPLPRVVMTEFSHAAEVARISRRLEDLLQQVMRELD